MKKNPAKNLENVTYLVNSVKLEICRIKIIYLTLATSNIIQTYEQSLWPARNFKVRDCNP